MNYVQRKVCAFTPTNEEDAQLFGDNYLRGLERHKIQFVMHFDRCKEETKKKFIQHPLCVGHTSQDNPNREYTEQDKQACFDVVWLHKNEYDWALHLDMDEWLERTADQKMEELLPNCQDDMLVCRWVNTWEKREQLRIGEPFGNSIQGNPRVKLYNLKVHPETAQKRRWFFDHTIIYGCKLVALDGTCPSGYGTERQTDLVFVHFGLMTHDLRVLHRDRWNRVYGKAVGENPYQLWNHLVETENEQHQLVPNPYL